jgi:hypothetical protein
MALRGRATQEPRRGFPTAALARSVHSARARAAGDGSFYTTPKRPHLRAAFVAKKLK